MGRGRYETQELVAWSARKRSVRPVEAPAPADGASFAPRELRFPRAKLRLQNPSLHLPEMTSVFGSEAPAPANGVSKAASEPRISREICVLTRKRSSAPANEAFFAENGASARQTELPHDVGRSGSSVQEDDVHGHYCHNVREVHRAAIRLRLRATSTENLRTAASPQACVLRASHRSAGMPAPSVRAIRAPQSSVHDCDPSASARLNSSSFKSVVS